MFVSDVSRIYENFRHDRRGFCKNVGLETGWGIELIIIVSSAWF